jgi:hypothetical protein
LCGVLPVSLSDTFFTTLASKAVLSDDFISMWNNTLVRDFDFTGCVSVTNAGIKTLISKFGPSIEGLRYLEFVVF